MLTFAPSWQIGAIALAIGFAWLCYMTLFAAAEMPSLPMRNDLGQPWLRVQLWAATLDTDVLLNGWIGGDWQNVGFRSRLFVGAAALFSLLMAYAPGRLIVDGMLPAAERSRLECTVFSLGLGLQINSLATLVLGLAGLATNWMVFLPAIGCWITLLFLRLRGREATSLVSSRSDERRAKESPVDRRFWQLVLLAAIPFATVILLGAMLPPHEFDVREYHLQVPKEWYQQGYIGFLPHNVYGNMPLGAELHALMAMCLWPESDSWWWGALVGKTVMACFMPLTAAALFAAGRRWLSPLAGAVAALLYVSSPWIARTAMQGLNEPAVACYGLLAVYAACIAASGSSKRWAWFAIAGAMAGAAVSCKYPALLFFGVPLASLPIVMQCCWTLRWPTNNRSNAELGEHSSNDSIDDQSPSSASRSDELVGAADSLLRPRSVRRQSRTGTPARPETEAARHKDEQECPSYIIRSPVAAFSLSLVFCISMLLSCGLWFGKNSALTGNPTYPLLYEWFDGATRTAEKNAQWQAAHGGGLHWTVASVGESLMQIGWRSEWLSPLVVPLAMIGVIFGWRVRALRQQVVIVLGLLLFGWLAWYGVTHRIDRFLVPLLPLLCLLGGMGACWSNSIAWRWVLSCMVAMGLLLNFATVSSFAMGDPRILVDLERLRLHDSLRVDPVHAWLNENAPPGSKVLLVGDAEPFDLRIPVIYNTVFDDNRFEQIMRGKSADQRREALCELGITHIYFHWGHIARYRSPGNYGFTDYVTQELVNEELVNQQNLLEEVPPFGGSLYEVIEQ